MEVALEPGDTDPGDYVGGLPFDTVSVAFNPGDRLGGVVELEISGDRDVEADETFSLTLQNPVGGTISETENTAVGTIINDDVTDPTPEPPTVIVGTNTEDVLIGDSGVDLIFGLDRDDVLLGGGGNDVLEGGNGEDIFIFSGEFGNDIITDFDDNRDQLVFVGARDDEITSERGLDGTLLTVDNENVKGSVFLVETGLFGNSIYISDVQVEEGHGGNTREAVFTVSLSSAVAAPVTVDFATADGTATAGSDYTAVEGTLTFAPGVTEQEVRVPVHGDDVIEPNETFFVNLSNPVNDVIADGQGEGTIVNDDDASLGSDDDVLTGGDGDDVLIGGSGDDRLKGAGGDDRLVGGSDDDTVRGNRGDDDLAGGSGDDVLRGGSGDDVLRGGSGNDTLYSGAGNDELTGGSGEDVFDFGSLSASNGAKEQDLIRDYTPGEDVIMLPGRAPTDADVLDTGLNSITIALPDSPDGDTLEILGVNSLDDVTFITK